MVFVLRIVRFTPRPLLERSPRSARCGATSQKGAPQVQGTDRFLAADRPPGRTIPRCLRPPGGGIVPRPYSSKPRFFTYLALPCITLRCTLLCVHSRRPTRELMDRNKAMI